MGKNKFIYVNQIGYAPKGSKYAYVKGSIGGEAFYLVNKDGISVFTGKIQVAVEDKVAGEPICKIDFSDFEISGVYYIKIDDFCSVSFNIGTGLYNDLFFSILNYFYMSRCGQDIAYSSEKFPNLWNHPACHTGVAEIYGTDKTKQVLGGWHDAGDYGRYVVAGSKTVMDLLLTYDAVKEKFTEFDILSEVRFELEWMLQMQREDGAVYHKISCYHFCPFILPQNETDKLVLSPISTSATADFAGCLAHASIYFKNSDFEFAETLLKAALKAQKYLDTHEDELYKNPPEITTGGYGDWNVKDERYFALTSLFTVTGNDEYLKKAMKIREEAKKIPFNEKEPWKLPWIENFGWGSVAGYGTELLLKNKSLIKDEKIIQELETAIKETADRILNVVENASFGTSLVKVFWGSNGAVCDNAHLLLLANDLFNNKDYYEAAKKQLDYLMGCNPLNICYVSGKGTNTVKNPHHRPSGFVKKAMPGMLAGGPSEFLADEVAKKYLQEKSPLNCYIDIEGSYCTNEVAIYWNSPLTYLVAKTAIV